ncbi:unnamed protein product [Rhizoctonia solani]|uniref:F-box domain-containing protein n=1 Tax=Rhizoctonia solani TaxID=456999 RepID=A0A8H3BZI6_9AGAM|nr:unnamed protein product [Rhizoctonia solani]
MAGLATYQTASGQAQHREPSAPMSSLAQPGRDILNINNLPPELLSYIFVFGEQAERFTRTNQATEHVRFPDVASQVCRHWRIVAINNPALWTYVVMKRPGEREVAMRYVSRTGLTDILDIEIEMRTEFWHQAEISPIDWIAQRAHTYDLLETLKTMGATPDRWRTLSVWVRQPEPLFEVVSFLHSHATPVLQCLSLRWGSKSMQSHEESRAINGMEMSLRSLVLSGTSAPCLRHVESTSVPWPFILERPSPLFTGLISLSLTAATRLISVANLTPLLRGNPRLESLHLSSEPDELKAAYSSFLDRFSHTECVPLISLRSLSIQSAYSRGDWILDILKAIRAPNLETFTLATELYADYASGTTDYELRLLNYLSGSDLDGDASEPITSTETTSIYPLLHELDVSRVSCQSGGRTMITLLSSFPSISSLSIASHQMDCLGRSPWLLPRLKVLRLSGLLCSDLGNVLRRRNSAGYPIPFVELQNYQYWDQEDRDIWLSTLPDGVAVTEYPESEDISDNDGSEAGDWEDEANDPYEHQLGTESEWMEGAGTDSNDSDSIHEYPVEYEQEEYEPSDGYSETAGYSEDFYFPACWVDDNTFLDDIYGLDNSGGPHEGYHEDFDPFTTDVYFDGLYGYDGLGEYDGGEFSEDSGGWDDYGDGDGYDYDYDSYDYGQDDYIDSLGDIYEDAYDVDF